MQPENVKKVENVGNNVTEYFPSNFLWWNEA